MTLFNIQVIKIVNKWQHNGKLCCHLFDIGDCYCDDKEWLCFGNNDFCKVVLEWQNIFAGGDGRKIVLQGVAKKLNE